MASANLRSRSVPLASMIAMFMASARSVPGARRQQEADATRQRSSRYAGHGGRTQAAQHAETQAHERHGQAGHERCERDERYAQRDVHPELWSTACSMRTRGGTVTMHARQAR